MGMVIQGRGTCLPIRETAQQVLRRLQRLTGLVEEMQKNYPNISLTDVYKRQAQIDAD